VRIFRGSPKELGLVKGRRNDVFGGGTDDAEWYVFDKGEEGA
jgi:hypothetical protein